MSAQPAPYGRRCFRTQQGGLGGWNLPPLILALLLTLLLATLAMTLANLAVGLTVTTSSFHGLCSRCSKSCHFILCAAIFVRRVKMTGYIYLGMNVTPPRRSKMIRTNLFHFVTMAFGNCFLRFRQDGNYKKNDDRRVYCDNDPEPVVHTPVSELRIRIPRIVSCTDCAENRILQHYEPESVRWSCDDCVGGGILPLYMIKKTV